MNDNRDKLSREFLLALLLFGAPLYMLVAIHARNSYYIQRTYEVEHQAKPATELAGEPKSDR